jgi:hypothetical protein
MATDEVTNVFVVRQQTFHRQNKRFNILWAISFISLENSKISYIFF